MKPVKSLKVIGPIDLKSLEANLEHRINDSSIWKRIIDIKTQLLELQSPSFLVKNQIVGENYVDFEIEDLDEAKFIKKIETVFQTSVDISEMHSFFYSKSEITSSITEEIMDDLKQEAEKNFIDFRGLPIIEGKITHNALIDYQQKIKKEKVGFIQSNKHLIEASDLSKTISILNQYNENIKRD